jgi:hypothetical protein
LYRARIRIHQHEAPFHESWRIWKRAHKLKIRPISRSHKPRSL